MAKQAGEAISSFSADARALIDNLLGNYKKKGTDEAFYVQAWSGDYYAADRITRSEIVLFNPWLSLLWIVQPDKVRKLAEQPGMFDSGFYQRVLVCVVSSKVSKMSRDKVNLDTAKWNELINELIGTYRLGSHSQSAIVEPNEEARNLLYNFRDEIVDLQNSKFSDIPSIAGKWGENAWPCAFTLPNMEPRVTRSFWNWRLPNKLITIVRWFGDQQVSLIQESRWNRKVVRVEKIQSLICVNGGEIPIRKLRDSHTFEPEEVKSLAKDFPSQIRIEERKPKGAGRPSSVVVAVPPN